MELVYQGRPNPLYFVGSLILGALLMLSALLMLLSPDTPGGALFFFALGGVVLLRPVLKILGAHYTMTSTSLVQREGIISRNTSEVEISDVRNIQVKQGIVERIFGLGSILVSTAGQGGIEIVFWGIKDPREIAQRVRSLRQT